MLDELARANYGKLTHMFRPLGIHLATRAILAGTTRAQVWVDDATHPRCALARLGHRLFLAGAPRADFADAVSAWLAHHRAESPFVVYYAPVAWQAVLAPHLPDVPTPRLREYYRLAQSPTVTLPAGFTLQFVTAALLVNSALANLAALKEELCSECASVDEFLAHSFGVVARHDRTLAGWCLSEYNTDAACEIGIATMEPYQRRGIATALTAAFVAYAHTRGVTAIGWHCYASNTASRATARRAGFERVCAYPSLFIH